MMTVFEIVNLYIEINDEIINKRLENVNQYFIRITNILKEIKNTL